MINLNDFVDKIYCINLQRRSDRWFNILKEFSKIEIDVERFNAVDGQKFIPHPALPLKGQLGALRSHVGVLKDAIKNKYEKICVFEDDIIFCNDFKERFNYYVNNVPDDWDIMYLGCHFYNCDQPKYITNFIYKNSKCYGCFAMILNNKNDLFKKIINVAKEEKKPIDNYIGEIIMPSINAYCFIPFFVKTANVISDISDETDPFEYSVVNDLFQDNVDLKKDKSDISQIGGVKFIQKIKGNKELYNNYKNSSDDFEIFYRQHKLFDSRKNNRKILCFENDFFTIDGKKFLYNGIRIKKQFKNDV